MTTGTSHPGRIAITTGTFTDTCTTEYDLISNAAKRPAVREMMEYANRRALTTLITSGVVTPYGINNAEKTKIPEVSTKGKPLGNNAFQFPVMGRIEKASVIIRQVGSTTPDGRFQLLMQDRHLFDGMNAVFNGGRFIAMVDGNPQPSSGGYLYTFWAPSGDQFSWTTHVSGQAGTKTCMGAYTSYGEKSQKSDSRSKFADMFVQHTTIQRSTCAITGTAASQVLWYTFTSADGNGSSKGWMYEELAQQQAQFVIQNERQKLFGVSSMKNSDGSLRTTPPINSHGEPLVAGDGWEEQVAGGNVFEGSGTSGEWTVDDLKQLMKQLEKKSDQLNGLSWIMITGTDGFANFQTQCIALGIEQNIQIFNNVSQDGKPGGAIVNMGYNFASFNVNGNQILCCKHPIFDDELMWTERGADDNILMSSTAFVMNAGSGSAKNMEIFYKAANGINRDNVTAKINGLTGASEMSISEEDALKYALLKEDMLVIFNTQECGILRKVR